MAAAFASFVVAGALALSQVTGSLPSPAATVRSGEGAPLREIGRVRATTPVCRALLADASAAIDLEDGNDRRLDEAVDTLAHIDLDSGEMATRRGAAELTRQYAALRQAAVSAAGAMKRFRANAKAVDSAEQQKRLASFAQALDGALHRQKTLADDMGRFLAYVDAHGPITQAQHDRMEFDAVAAGNDLRTPHRAFDACDFGPTEGVPQRLTTIAQTASSELAKRALPIAEDESDAAARIEPAFKGC